MRIAIVDPDALVRNWWIVLLRGVVAILFGLCAFVLPGITLAALVLLFGAYALIDGILGVVTAIRRHGTTDRWWVLLVEGLVSFAAGVLTLLWPAITALVLLWVIAAWALVTGVLEIVAAVRLRKAITGEWLLVLGGIASLAFGILLVVFPAAGALAVVWWIGAYALLFGVLLVALAFRLHAWGRSHGGAAAPSAA